MDMTLSNLAQLLHDTMEEVEYQMDNGQKEKYMDRYMRVGQLMDELETLINDLAEDLNEEEFHL